MVDRLQNYLRNYGLDGIQSNLSIVARRHNKYNNLVLLKYHQINSPMNNPITQMCRGIILDENNDWQVVCRAYDKFFNYEEICAAPVDFENAKIFEKLDGSLCQLYYYDGHWNIATSGSPDASGNVGDFNYTFADLFWKVWKEHGYTLPIDTKSCYVFELMTPYNTIVVQHKVNSLVLHGGRNLNTMRELNPVIEAHHNHWQCVKSFPFDSIEAIHAMLSDMSGTEQEGFVVCDINYNRVKMKCEDYVVKHRFISSMSQRNLLDIVRTNEGSEVLLYVKQFDELYHDIRSKFERLRGEIHGYYNAIKHIDDRKQFAAMATTQKFSGILFGVHFGKVATIEDALATMNIKNLEQWLDLKVSDLEDDDE